MAEKGTGSVLGAIVGFIIGLIVYRILFVIIIVVVATVGHVLDVAAAIVPLLLVLTAIYVYALTRVMKNALLKRNMNTVGFSVGALALLAGIFEYTILEGAVRKKEHIGRPFMIAIVVGVIILFVFAYVTLTIGEL